MLYVARHGETEWNALNKVLGRTDIPLDARGTGQARELARSVADLELDEIIASPLGRTRQTAEIISAETGAGYRTDDRLIEQEFGRFEGVDRSDRGFQEAKRKYCAGYPGTESHFEMAARVVSLLRETAGRNVLLVTHGGICRIIRNYFEEMDREDFVCFSQANCELRAYDNSVIRGSGPSVQTTDTVLMVRPAAFGFNEETAASNAFQKKGEGSGTAAAARRETDAYIALLRENGISVIAAEDTEEPRTPDAVFPNNWFSVHDDGTLVLYPMLAENRRLEREPAVLEAVRANSDVRRTVDLTHFESEGLFLEGTGSMVLDRVNRIAYACRSPRTSGAVLEYLCLRLGYRPLVFDAAGRNGAQIYHTNVMMHVGSRIAVVCTEAIRDPVQRSAVIESLGNAGKMIVEISIDQMERFAGNMLELRSGDGEPCLVMSRTAHDSLSEDQTAALESEMKLIVPALDCIEKYGGGSARCMLAEIF